jgi:hypothetical protein
MNIINVKIRTYCLLSVYLYNPCNTTTKKYIILLKAGLKQDNVISVVVLDGLYKYTDSLL